VTLSVTYLIPPLGLCAGIVQSKPLLAALALAAWIAMALAYRPTAQLYRLPAFWLPTLPLAAALYAGMTLDSAIRHRRGAGGRWKGRVLSPR
jgi:hypothetical protein